MTEVMWRARSLTPYERELKKKLSQKLTKAEKTLCLALDAQQIPFSFQKVIALRTGEIRVLDFYFKKAKLIVEVDGGYHATPEQVRKDRIREIDIFQTRPTFTILRFRNDEVLSSTDWVVGEIVSRL